MSVFGRFTAFELCLGEHPRIGALDVCPFIPILNVTMQDCVDCAKEFGERLATELGVPGIHECITSPRLCYF